jgi:hypothetical protein
MLEASQWLVEGEVTTERPVVGSLVIGDSAKARPPAKARPTAATVWTDWFGWLAAHSGEKVEPTSVGSEAYTPTRMHPEVTCWRSSSVLVEYDPTFGVMEAEARAEAGAERGRVAETLASASYKDTDDEEGREIEPDS